MNSSEETKNNSGKSEGTSGKSDRNSDSRDDEISRLTRELKSSEERTRLIMANIPVGLIVTRADGTIEAANSKIESLFQHKRSSLAQQPLGMLFAEGLDHEKGSNSCTTRQLFGRKSDGQRFPCEVTEVEVETPQGKRTFVFISNITERYELEELKRDFVSMVSHDLSTPLSSVKLCLDSITSGMYGELSGDGLAMVDRVKTNVERLIALINDLLCMDKLEAGQLTIKRRETRLTTIVERSMDSVLGLSEAKRIAVKQFFHGGTGGEDIVDKPVSLDEARMIQVLVNLLSNAIKFSPEGSSIKLAAWTEGPYTCFTVADNGVGIDDQLKSLVFEKYKQLDRFNAEEQSRVKGFGLGLSICKNIVEQHQGKIWIENTSGSSGCTFQIRLPKLD